MSTEPRSLGEFIAGLVDELGAGDPVALLRLRAIVENRRARIRLDRETVTLHFEGAALMIDQGETTGRSMAIDGEGSTSRQTVLDLLDARIEVFQAVLGGHLQLRGNGDSVVRICLAIEILLDASARVPGIRRLAEAFRRQAPAPASLSWPRMPLGWVSTDPAPAEMALLKELDLLPQTGS